MVVSPRVREGVALTTGTTSEIVDTYTVKLSVAPTSDVTVDLAYDDRLEVKDESGSVITQLTFDQNNWDTLRTLTVSATADTVNELSAAIITHSFSSTDSRYTNAEAVELDVTVIDDDAPRVVVTESDGNTKVIRGGAGDDNTVRLVNAPTDDGTVNLYRRR